MEIRESNTEDHAAISRLHAAAFGEAEGPTIAKLAVDLLEDPTARPLLSLVAEKDGGIVGHVIFSSVMVDAVAYPGGYIMAPLAVAPESHRQGAGSELVNRGLDILRERDAAFVLVLGDPKYYSRFGFAAGHALKPPHELPYPEAWMALELKREVIADLAGTVRCADSLNAPEHW